MTGAALLLKEIRKRELWPQLVARLKFNDCHDPHSGEFCSGGGGEDTGTDTVQNAVTRVFNRMGIAPDAVPVNIVDKDPREFVVGDMKFSEGGHFDPTKNEIEINTRGITTPAQLEPLVAHEATHYMYNWLENQQTVEHARIRALPSAEIKRLFQANGYPRHAAMAELQQRFPVSAMFAKHISDGYLTPEPGPAIDYSAVAREALAKEDGVTKYSESYWSRDWQHLSGGFTAAVNETLAEISSIKLGNPGQTKPTAPNWTALHFAVVHTYRNQMEQQSRHAAAH
jgi:hypothetical protein